MCDLVFFLSFIAIYEFGGNIHHRGTSNIVDEEYWQCYVWGTTITN
jgi:hypothetical protein